ncbi:uncharacterized protein [Rutidosis leptorrhynchoides]|uniref:uncharacterized protein n=1 Tax=Rutidosis leptorrhynchoides TaxID=125765 RepID=UPI003A99F87A
MDSDERLTALKKAYADIILNTAKEAAARIMLSERKAVRFEYELKHAKNDSMQMLLRLKQMMDSKVSEAAMISCSQQKKIEELEAQLQEAEDIVKDLREELREVEAELRKFSRSKHVDNTLQILPNSNIDCTNGSHKFYNSVFPLNKSLFANGDLPSIISRSKETELYRNGCTQRIRVCERTPPDENISFSVHENEVNAELIAKKDEVIEKEIVLEQVKEMDLGADISCLTSPNSVKHANDIVSKSVVEDLVQACSSQSTSGEELMPVKQEKDEVDPQFTSSELKVSKTNEVESQPLTDRVIKYTFHRKRKRGALIDGSVSSERSEENEMDNVGPAKVNLIGESTPEKIRLEQVANQLVSLS